MSIFFYVSYGATVFFRKGTEIPSLLENPIIQLVADNHKVDPAHVLLKYFVQQGISVVPKSITPSRIVNNSKVRTRKGIHNQCMKIQQATEKKKWNQEV